MADPNDFQAGFDALAAMFSPAGRARTEADLEALRASTASTASAASTRTAGPDLPDLAPALDRSPDAVASERAASEVLRCEAMPVGLFGPVRCPQTADYVAVGVCRSSHPSELVLCRACTAALTNGGRHAINGPCACGRPVVLAQLETIS